MNITKENLNDVNIVLTISIEKADYEETVATALKEYRQKAVIPGFRPGKIPAGLVQKRFGKAILAEEVNKVLTKSLSKYIVDEKLAILGEPLPNEEMQKTIDFDKDEVFEFVFDIGLAPKVDIVIDKSSKYDYYLIKVDEEMINSRVGQIASQYGSNHPADDVDEKSLVRGDYTQLGADGNELENGISAGGILVAVDRVKDENIKNSFIGKKASDTLVFDPVVAFGSRHEVGHMLNISHEKADTLEGEFKFEIKEIDVFKPAEVNEELVKLIYGEESETKTVEQFREKVKDEIAKSLLQSSEVKFARDTHDVLVENIKTELPEVFLKRWLKLRNDGLTDDQIEADFGNFMKDLKWQIIRDTIIKSHNLDVSEEEALNFARQFAFSQFYQYGYYNVSDEQIDSYAKTILGKEEEKERIYRILYEDKVMAVIKEEAEIVEKVVTNEEFESMMK